jgi:Uma2 family endonuclease
MTATINGAPPLESGDHLTRAEFHRRYCARPDIKKAELVEGVVYVASPVRMSSHGKPHGILVTWLGTYAAKHTNVEMADNTTVYMDSDNEVQPDAFLFSTAGASARVTEDDYVEGAPELVVEVAASSASYDLFEKMRVYRRNGVQEYIVWQTLENRLDWFRLGDGEYVAVAPDERGTIESTVFPGLRLNVIALLAGDSAAALAALER